DVNTLNEIIVPAGYRTVRCLSEPQNLGDDGIQNDRQVFAACPWLMPTRWQQVDYETYGALQSVKLIYPIIMPPVATPTPIPTATHTRVPYYDYPTPTRRHRRPTPTATEECAEDTGDLPTCVPTPTVTPTDTSTVECDDSDDLPTCVPTDTPTFTDTPTDTAV